MGVLDAVRGRNRGRMANLATSDPNPADATNKETHGPNHDFTTDTDSTLSLEERNEKEVIENGDRITADAQLGVKKAEAAALVWPRWAVFATYGWIWVCFFALALQSAILNYATQYAYASFAAAPQVATAGILANVIGGVLKLPIAKTLNLWGRAEGFLVFVAVYLIGMIILAACKGPNGYAAGYVLYWIGFDAIYFIMDVFIADTTGLKNRAFAFAFASTPYICTAFTGSPAFNSFYKRNNDWRWSIGAFCIIQVFVFVPLAVVFKFYQRKAAKQGLFVRQASGRTTAQSIKHYIYEFDVVGCLLLIAAFILFLLPFSLQNNGRAGYHSATFIAMIVIGILLFPAFAAWERFAARTHFIRWELFKKRTVLGASCLAAILYFSFYSWDLYFYNFVYVVYDLTITDAGYMTQIYNVGSTFWGVVFGIWVRYTKHFKWTCLFFALPLQILGAGLMIHFRGQDSNIGYIVMCQIFIAFAGGTLVIGEDMAVMAAADRDGVPMMLALIGLCANLGGAIGYAVSAAIYTNTFPDALASALPAESAADASTIYLGGVVTQRMYPPGNATRDAIDYAWGHSQKYGCVSATAILVLAIPAIAVWKNYNVNKAQNKGTMI